MTPEELDQIRTIIREENAPMKQEIAAVKQYLLDFRAEMLQRLELIEEQLDTQVELFKGVGAVMATTVKSESVQRRLSNQLADLESRVRKLEGAPM